LDGTNFEAGLKTYHNGIISDLTNMFESELNSKLLWFDEIKQGYKFEFNLKALLSTSIAERVSYYQFLVQNGIANRNEIRVAEDFEKIDMEEMNWHTVQSQNIPLSADYKTFAPNNDKQIL